MQNIATISDSDFMYYRRLRRNLVFSELLAHFAYQAETNGLTRRSLAKRLNKDPAQISRWLSEPTNLCLDTISDLLVAMGGEMEFRIVPQGEEYTADEFMEDFRAWSHQETASSLSEEISSASAISVSAFSWWTGEYGEQEQTASEV